ncbi:MAG TPA: ATP-dependent helicase HrpB [Bryobacteraceae bacterium]|nr:ATP-dependent helicase HrpB [Bryobacteraceae bacterium]
MLLPADAVIPDVLECLRKHRTVVVEAPPGAGKTTRIPPALLQLGGEVLVLEPRRLAARMAARRVAAEMGEEPGGTVGWQVRFDQVTGPRTRLRFVTEGVLTRRLLSDPQLDGVNTVVLDEFHERHLDGDVALALLRRLQTTSRPDLRLVVMSATLNAEPLTRYLGCPSVRSEGRLFDIRVEYAGYSGAPLEDQVAAAVERVLAEQSRGHVLAFLPGAAEIRKAEHACQALGRRHNLALTTLHGDLPPEEQDRAVAPSDRRKLILSTNIAESSLTIEGVAAVIDSGLARIPVDSPETGLPGLQVRRISKAAATQRAGRAGRTGPGIAVRLYSAEDFARRPEHEMAEILRRDLTPVVLQIEAAALDDVAWFEAPPEPAWRAAEALLRRLQAGQDPLALARLPVHPRLARMLSEGQRRGVGSECCAVAGFLSVGDRPSSLDLLDAPAKLSPAAERVAAQLRRLVRARPDVGSEDDVRQAILSGWPDRVATRKGESDVQLCGGGIARLAGQWRWGKLLVAVDVEDRRPAIVRSASFVKPDWLLDMFPDAVTAVDEAVWNPDAERVESRSALLYDGLVIDESRSGAVDPEAAAELLSSKAVERGVEYFTGADELASLRARLAFAAAHSDLRAITAEDLTAALKDLCAGHRSFSELRAACEKGAFTAALLGRLGHDAGRKLEAVAPQHIRIGRRTAPVQYQEGQPPSVASRLQDFFGMRRTPTIAGGVPLTVLLLAPNGRPVQTTSDLEGFWTRLYPQVRRELGRRYPRHSWPDNPLG